MLARALKTVRDGLLSLAYPEECQICGDQITSWDDGRACSRCWTDPTVTKLFLGLPRCARCGVPRSVAADGGQRVEVPQIEAWHCGNCDELPFSAARACGAYSGALEASILFLKSQPHVCPRLRKTILRAYAESSATLASDVVIPIPLSRKRARARGFNQAALVAKVISNTFKLPVDDGTLTRIKQTDRHRAGMDRLDRARSVERAFEVRRPRLVKNAAILLIDDLYTTGATISAAARVLLESGARRVSVFTIARVTERAAK